VTDAEARRVALSLPDAVEMDHHSRPSFRVNDRIFATLWVAGRMNVMLDIHGIMDAVDTHPNVCTEIWWGRRLAAVQIDLAAVKPSLLKELLSTAHARKAVGRKVRRLA
jgi:hypothetical protein